jgi:uncharacterized protein (DUF1501 family)
MNVSMKRREFLRKTLMTSVAAGAGLGMSMPARLLAACTTVDMPRTMVNLMFYGGMDSKFIFMPSPLHPDANYLDKLWAARANLYPGYPDYATMFGTEYDAVTDPLSGLDFGIYNRCGWLKTEFEAGRVAVIANSFCSKNRRHDQSQLNANLGVPTYSDLYYNLPGWGGKLVEQLAGTANTVEISHEISVFGNGTIAGERLKNVIHAKNTRDIALPNPDAWSPTDRRSILTRALKSYYEARGSELKSQTNSPFNLFFQHNQAFREFGDAVKTRLDDCGPLPDELAGLNLFSNHFENQCKNLYDVCLAPDILNVGTVSMRYDGWDTHNNQYGRIGNNLEDVFGSSGGLATALQQIATIPTLGAPAQEQLAIYVSSDFGRQLRANGGNGTDHGRGLYSILAGYDVNGGLYGEMFPAREAIEENGKIPMETSGADVLGLTSTERVLAEACEWMQPGSSAAVFPNAGSSDIEIPGMLDTLFV